MLDTTTFTQDISTIVGEIICYSDYGNKLSRPAQRIVVTKASMLENIRQVTQVQLQHMESDQVRGFCWQIRLYTPLSRSAPRLFKLASVLG